jgi:FAD-linked oxidoreductase
VTCEPRAIETPANEAELVALVRRAAAGDYVVRVAGTGHSFTPLCASEGLLIALDGLQGIVAADRGALKATVWAGTKIQQMGEPLRQAGLAMENMGDIDRQSLAGAISTGTHGTGRGIGSISTQVIGLRLLTAGSDIIDCSAETEPDIFKAGQVSLGALGIITQVTLRLLPAYDLRERSWVIPVEACIAEIESLIAANRHFEFFWSPQEDACAAKTLNPMPQTNNISQEESAGFKEASAGADEPRSNAGQPAPGSLSRYIKGERSGPSHRIFPSERNVRFNEIEFAVAEAQGPDCFREIRRLMQRKYPAVTWPIEYRTLGADDIDLSPAYERDSVTISVHQAGELPYQAFFADVEAIFRNYRGRPHWGKIHTHTARELRDLYPMWAHFQAVRTRLDPQGRFLNSYLRSLFD